MNIGQEITQKIIAQNYIPHRHCEICDQSYEDTGLHICTECKEKLQTLLKVVNINENN